MEENKKSGGIPFPTIDYLLRSAWRATFKMYNGQAAKYNSSSVIGFTLLSIDPHGGTPSTSLGPKMGIEPTSLSRTINKMVGQGLIYRKPNPKDGRSVLICLTDYGQQMRETSKNIVLTFNNKIRETVNDDQKMDHFFEVIGTIRQLIINNQIFNEEK